MTRYQVSLLVRNRAGRDAVYTHTIEARDMTDACRAFAPDGDAYRHLASHIYKSLSPGERVVSVVNLELLCEHEGRPCSPSFELCRCECTGCTAPEWEEA